MSKKTNLASKLVKVSAAVTGLKKDGYNAHHKYKFVSHDSVVNAVSDALNAQGVNFSPSIVSVSREGKSYLVEMSFVFSCQDTGETEQCKWFGEGQDSQDKGLYKALTQAKKTFLLNRFLIATGEQFADGDHGYGYEKRQQPKPPPPPPKPPELYADLPAERKQKARAKFFALAGELIGDAGDTKEEAYKLCADILGRNDKGETSLSCSTVTQVSGAIKLLDGKLQDAKRLAHATGLQKRGDQ